MWISSMAERERCSFALAAESSVQGSGLDVEPNATFRNVFWTKNSLWIVPISGSGFSLQLMERERLINSQAYFHTAKSRALLAE